MLDVRFMNPTGSFDYVPHYATPNDACMDLKACMPDSTLIIEPGETAIVSSGIKVAVPEGHVMMMFVRSSIGIKKHLCLANGTGIIDSGYRDEVMMALHNFGKEPVKIADGDRVCQFMVLPRPEIQLVETFDEEVFNEGNRGGGIGSTGK